MVNSRMMMADAKFYEAYARYKDDESRYESWDEAVLRVMDMHREYTDGRGKMSTELEELLSGVQEAYSRKEILGAQRALQFGGEQLLKHQARLYNCFHENTEFITSEGVFKFSDFEHGEKVKVLTHKGGWKNAVVKNYGIQTMNKVTLGKGSTTTDLIVTPNHRWILKDGSETIELKEGDNIYKPKESFSQFDYNNATPDERLYWCYGMVYGDGTRTKNSKGEYTYSLIRLCGHDKQFKSRFEEIGFSTSTNHSLNGDYFAYTGTYLKTAPDPKVDSIELIRAFVAGYLQADGGKNKNKEGSQYKSIQSSELDHINFIRNCFPLVGAYITSETELTGQKTNYGVRPYTIKFTIADSFGSKYNAGWKVVNIQTAWATEPVWCLEVEEDKSFVMPNGVVTGNCSAAYCDRAEFFGEAFYLMLCGAGVGFSVQKQHVASLPPIAKRTKTTKEFIVPDSIEGWAQAIDVLLSSFFIGGGKHPEYEGRKIYFNLEKIRPKGAFISGGFKAPGSEALRVALDKVEALLKQELSDGKTSLRPIVAYDIVMFIADAVISGGVRRSATICLFSKDDEEMLNAKTGDWFVSNPQRGRSNNSAILLRDETSLEELEYIMQSVKEVGEPGFIFSDDLEALYNPCVEIGMRGYDQEGNSGFQFCNL